MFFRRQRSEGIEGLDRIRESLRQQQQERRERGEADDLLVTDPSELEEGVAVIKPVRETQSPEPEPEPAPEAEREPEPVVSAATEEIEPTPFVEAPAPAPEPASTPSAPVSPPPPAPEPAVATTPPPASTSAPPTALEPVAPTMTPAPDRTRRPEVYKPTGNGESLIARNASWDGQLYAEGDVRIEGALQGSIEAQATVFIAQDARVNAKIRARNIVIAGEFDGEIVCDEKLEVLPSGSIAGQVNASMLVIHEGAFVDSRFAMNVDSATARNAR